MGKFDQFKNGLAKLGRGENLPARSDDSATSNPLLTAARQLSADRLQEREIDRSKSAHFAIALDATGSMATLLQSAKASLSEIIRRVTHEAGRPIKIQLFAYRDYDCGPQVLESSSLSGDANNLIAWLSRVEAMGGGSNDGEAIEFALGHIKTLGGFRSIIIAGDEPPNGQVFLASQGRAQSQTAQQLAARFGADKTPIHTFVVGDHGPTIIAFREIADASGGKSGRLDGSAAMIDMAVLAMLATLKGKQGVRDYVARTALTSNAAAFATLLLGDSSK
uniref:hypothetical protein n=1 Tax=uncultured Caulobacter sp. TaxID=158749 RepID=UPI00260067F1|nr:hypothetical protein [uncultured Caulobacter sp.]